MLLATVLVAVGVLLIWIQVRHVHRVAAKRRNVLSGAQQVLDEPRLEQQGIDYPVLTGRYRGHRVIVCFIVDTVALRGLPTLWLSLTVSCPLPLQGPIDFLLRPSATDIVSPGRRFSCQHEVASEWPAHLRIATPAGAVPPLSALASILPLLRDRRTKDVLLAPAGARLITEAARAELGQYRMVRRANFVTEVSAADLTSLLDSLLDLAQGLELALPTGRN